MMIGIALGLNTRNVPASGGLGPELIVNGDMSSATGWILTSATGGSTTIAAGKLMMSDPGDIQDGSATQAVSLSIGQTYRFSIMVDAIAGGGNFIFESGSTSLNASVPSELAGDFVADSPNWKIYTPAATLSTSDNASLRRVL